MTLTRAKVLARRWWIATSALLVAATLAAVAAWYGFDFDLRRPLTLLAFPLFLARAAHWSGWVSGHKTASAQSANLEAQK